MAAQVLRNSDLGLPAVELALVVLAVEVSKRLGDEAVVADPPILEPADMYRTTCTAGPGVRADERPAVHGSVPINAQVVQQHTFRSGKADMNPWATSVMASRPTAVYRRANACRLSEAAVIGPLSRRRTTMGRAVDPTSRREVTLVDLLPIIRAMVERSQPASNSGSSARSTGTKSLQCGHL